MSESLERESRLAARSVGLRYVSDRMPGIRRLGLKKRFRYVSSGGATIRKEPDLRRIRSLVIPPAWKEVWICPVENGHIQAVGKDVKGRKQYRYHARWRKARDENKYEKMIAFGKALPPIRRAVNRDMRKRGLPRDKVLGTVVKLLETTLIRVGNEEYARTNHSVGLTTMKDRHAKVGKSKLLFDFVGKSGVHHTVDIQDRRLAKIVKACRDLPGQELFQYRDEVGEIHSISSQDVNDYLHRIAGDQFTAKDFRTWAGTVLAATALRDFESFDSQTQAKKNVVAAIETVAKRLGNTKAVCRKCYVHPEVLEGYLDGTLIGMLQKKVEREIRGGLHRLQPEEAAVLAFLRARLKSAQR